MRASSPSPTDHGAGRSRVPSRPPRDWTTSPGARLPNRSEGHRGARPGAARGALRWTAGVLAWWAVAAAATAQPSPGAAAPDALPFLVQSACLDAADRIVPGRLPFEAGCARRRPLLVGEPLPYRKHDWPGTPHATALPRGWQASDALLGTLLGRPAAIHTADFGDPPRRFAQIDPGDGGVALPLDSHEVAAAMTEDGGEGVQWFLSPACTPGRAAFAPGWLYATLPLPAEASGWQEGIHRIGLARRPEDCPPAYGAGLTRWRLARIDLPWREAADGRTDTLAAEVLVSEHYGGPSISRADHLERTFMARDLGAVRWERWENWPLSRMEDRDRRAAIIADSRRCPPVALSDAPGPGWRMIGCRTWTNFVRARPGGPPLSPLDWPAPAFR